MKFVTVVSFVGFSYCYCHCSSPLNWVIAHIEASLKECYDYISCYWPCPLAWDDMFKHYNV